MVCTVCSPSGDKLPSDGLNKYYTLPDLRRPLVPLGMLVPQRLCLLCYGDSSYPGIGGEYVERLE
ncbi:hypothetical protein EON63_19965 [archaeon]|nr:MAG: hypothetical protein EON63_19965 [archaeon]